MTASLSFADVAEGVRTAIAAATQALDDGRTEDIVDAYCPDGSVTIPGLGTHEGHDALRAAYAGWEPKVPQRHLVLNTVVTEWSDQEARATSDIVFLLLKGSGWVVQMVGRYEDVLHNDGTTWRFHRRAATFVSP